MEPPSYSASPVGPTVFPSHISDQGVTSQVPPPSYESLYGRLKSAQEKSASKLHVCKHFSKTICSSVFYLIIIAVFTAFPITEIVVGVMYLKECPVQKKIPIYLIVVGVVTLAKVVSCAVQSCLEKGRKLEEEENNARINPIDMLLNIFILVWFILGNIWIYSTYGKWEPSATSLEYCQPTLFYFAFWSITSIYILAGVIGLLVLVLGTLCAYSSETTAENP